MLIRRKPGISTDFITVHPIFVSYSETTIRQPQQEAARAGWWSLAANDRKAVGWKQWRESEEEKERKERKKEKAFIFSPSFQTEKIVKRYRSQPAYTHRAPAMNGHYNKSGIIRSRSFSRSSLSAFRCVRGHDRLSLPYWWLPIHLVESYLTVPCRALNVHNHCFVYIHHPSPSLWSNKPTECKEQWRVFYSHFLFLFSIVVH